MPRIKTTSIEEAQGAVKAGYDMFIKNIGIIPKPMEMMSASPALFESQLKRIEYFSNHPNLSFPLLAHIRFLAAHHLNYSFCSDFNKMTLKKVGLTDEQIDKMTKDPSACLLEDNEKAILLFVLQSMKDPGSITNADIDDLKKMDWTDTDMVDALSQGVSMIDHSIMMQVFGMDQNCLV